MSPRDKKRKAREAAKPPKPPESTQVSKLGPFDQAAGPAKPQEATRLEEHPPRPAEHPAEGAPPVEQLPAGARNLPDWRSRRHNIWLDFRNGMLIAMALVALKLVFEDSWIVERFRLMTYDLMQHRLESTTSVKDLPVAVVDISDIGLVETDRPGRLATPREPLRHLLATIAGQRPRAIGIDIDFSPDEYGLKFRNDPEFFRFCLALRGPRNARIPVFLGVHRSDALRPEKWLDSEEFQALAASITVLDPRQMVEAISVTGSAWELPAMGAALAKSYRGGSSLPEPLRWMFRRTSEGLPDAGTLHAPEFSVDFGPLNALEEQTLAVFNADTEPVIFPSAKHSLSGKMVLLGNATREKALDQFTVPNRSETKPGVYLHACAAWLFGLAGASLLVGIWFVNRTRVMWEDSVLVAIALLIHSPVAATISWARRVIGAAWRAGVLTANNKEKRS